MILVDGGYFMWKAINELTNSKHFHEGDLIENMHKFVKELMQFSNQIIICKDHKTWRKDIYSKYKEQRKTSKKSIKTDFDKVFRAMEEYLGKFSKAGGNVYYINKAEADDIIFSFCIRSKEPICIVSPDRDLTQLLNERIIQLDPTNNKLFVSNSNTLPNNQFDSLENKTSMFFWSILSKYSECEIVEIDAVELVIEKIIVGDKSDNIDSIQMTTLGGRVYRYPKKHIYNIVDYCKVNGIGLNDLLRLEVQKDLYKEASKYLEMDPSISFPVFRLNTRLVVLHKDNFPEDIFNQLLNLPMDFKKITEFSPFEMKESKNDKGFDMDKWSEFL